jgi:ubiquinone/menaquinone biosynthesis C-methylase UbiE
MPFYKDHIYPHLVTLLGNPKPIRDIRQRVVPMAQGTVLEIGVGPGVNFPLYDPMRVSKIFALEPNPGMMRRAEEQARRAKLDIEFLDLPGERIPLAESSVDTVVSTFTLWTIPGVVDAIQGIARVLKRAASSFSSSTDSLLILRFAVGRKGPSRSFRGHSKAAM